VASSYYYLLLLKFRYSLLSTLFLREREGEGGGRESERVAQRELIISHAAENITVLFKHGKERDYGTNIRKASNNFINIIYRSAVKKHSQFI